MRATLDDAPMTAGMSEHDVAGHAEAAKSVRDAMPVGRHGAGCGEAAESARDRRPDAADVPPVVVLAGPTACGKSALAMALAEEAGAVRGDGPRIEIISMDSALVYRTMDIGTAKPSAAERAAVPHHLIDVCDPTQAYSAARFVQETHAAIAAIRARGAVPLIVGGTMLYYKALRDGLDTMPPADPQVRAQLDEQARAIGWAAMHARLAEVDPVSAQRLAPLDSQRIQRALEVHAITGVPLSQWQSRAQAQAPIARPGLQSATSTPLRIPVRLVAMLPQDRGWLHARIAQRFDAMLGAGFLDEVRALRAKPGMDVGLPSARCVGYRQAWEALDAAQARGGAVDLAALRERGIAATRQLAKRQMTWLRSLAPDGVIEVGPQTSMQQAVQTLAKALA